MPSALVASLAAPIREVSAAVGAGASDAPTSALTRIRDLLDAASASARKAWADVDGAWCGPAAMSAADVVASTARVAETLAARADELAAQVDAAAAAVADARRKLQDIVDRFEARAAALESSLDDPGAAAELKAEARTALDEAVAVVENLRAELDGRADTVAPTPAPTTSAGAAPAGGMPSFGGGSGLGGGAGTASGPGFGSSLGALAGMAGHRPGAARLVDPSEFGDGVAVRLPDGGVVTAPNAVAASAVRHALTQLGVPYVWGGTSPGVGLDCSGLTQWAYHEAGLDLPRLAQEQDVGASVARESVRPGDLAVWDGHVAMIVGDGLMVEAGDPVKLSPIRTTNAGQGFQGFWRPTA